MTHITTIETVPGYSHWCSRHWDEALVRRRVAGPGPPKQPRCGKEYSLVIMFGYAHSRYLMARMTPSPDVADDVDGRHNKSCKSSHRGQGEGGETSAGCMDESDQGPRRALAAAVAHPLRIQPGMHSIEESFSGGASC
jgi:hypothetical protein